MKKNLSIVVLGIVFLLLMSCKNYVIVSFKGDLDKSGVYEADENGINFESIEEKGKSYKLSLTPAITPTDIERYQRNDEFCMDKKCVLLILTIEGAEKFESFTAKNVGKRIFFVIDAKIVSSPFVVNQIQGGRISLPMSKKAFKKFFIVRK